MLETSAAAAETKNRCVSLFSAPLWTAGAFSAIFTLEQGAESAAVISSRNIALYCEQLATLLESGVPLNNTLMTLTRSAPSRRLRRISADLRKRINAGDTFAGALAAHRGHVPALLVSLLEVGEHSGRLERVARSLAKYYTVRWEIARDTITQLVPHVFYFFMCYVVMVFIGYVTSQWSSAFLIRVAENTVLTAACIALVVVAVRMIHPLRSAIVLAFSCVPPLSGIMRQYAVARFALAMSTSLTAGLEIRRAIALSADAMASPLLAPRVRRAIDGIRQGLTISQALRATKVFEHSHMGLVEAGEVSGRIVETMDQIAEMCRFRATTAAQATARIFVIVAYVAMLMYIALGVINLIHIVVVPIWGLLGRPGG
jgi:general secretion pathway protein F